MFVLTQSLFYNFPKAKTIDENENGGHLKIDDLNFEHIHESNTKIMTSLKTQIHFYYLSMTIINAYQCDYIVLVRPVWLLCHHIID